MGIRQVRHGWRVLFGPSRSLASSKDPWRYLFPQHRPSFYVSSFHPIRNSSFHPPSYSLSLLVPRHKSPSLTILHLGPRSRIEDLDPHRQLLYLPNHRSLLLATEGSTFVKLQSLLNDFVFFPLEAGHPIEATLTKFGGGVEGEITVSRCCLVRTSLLLLRHPVSSLRRKPIQIHGGFEQTWSRIYPQVLAAVQSALTIHQDVERIIFTGDSLGGAVALLDMLALRNDLTMDLPFEGLVFATPRIFNSIGARLSEKVVENQAAKISYVSRQIRNHLRVSH